jgi:hypothetical protein
VPVIDPVSKAKISPTPIIKDGKTWGNRSSKAHRLEVSGYGRSQILAKGLPREGREGSRMRSEVVQRREEEEEHAMERCAEQ